jgi:hypothetical protein
MRIRGIEECPWYPRCQEKNSVALKSYTRVQWVSGINTPYGVRYNNSPFFAFLHHVCVPINRYVPLPGLASLRAELWLPESL